MKVHVLKEEQVIEKPIDEVFDFFKCPENLEKITPSSLGFQILTPKPIVMEKGRLIDYSIKIVGIPQRWTTLITDYDPPHKFVDEQLKGPYSLWHHTHEFESRGNATLIKDTVRYVIGMGILGEFAHTLFVRNQLTHIFRHRKQVIADYLVS